MAVHFKPFDRALSWDCGGKGSSNGDGSDHGHRKHRHSKKHW